MFDFNTQSSNELLISAIFHILCYIWMIYFLKNTILFANLSELEEKKHYGLRGGGGGASRVGSGNPRKLV